MKKYFFTLLLLLIGSVAFGAADFATADKAYQEGNFTAAKTYYEQLIRTASGADLYRAQLRVAACEYSLGEFLNAAVRLYDYPLPQDPLWQARFLLYRVQMAKQVSGVYRPILNQTPIDTAAAQADKTQWTRQAWQAQIDKDFRRLWTLRDDLVDDPIEQENLILTLKNTDTQRLPTLFDFTVYQWKQYLQSNPDVSVAPLGSDTPSYLDGAARLKESPSKNTSLVISQLLAYAAQAEGKNRQNARLFWQTDATLQPFSNTAFVLEDKEKALQSAISQLQVITGQQPQNTPWYTRLKNRLTPPPSADYARSYAAWQLAQLLHTHQRYTQALETCRYANQHFAPSYYTQQCDDLAARITRVELSAQSSDQPLNRQHPALSFSGQNLTRVYARVYPTSFDELSALYRSHYNRRTVNTFSEVTRLDSQDIPAFAARTARYEKSMEVPYEEVGKPQTATLQLPALDEGFYVVLISTQADFDPAQTDLYGWVINATDLALFSSAAIDDNPTNYTALRTAAPKTLTPKVFHLYSVNLKTGQPAPHLPVQLITDWNGARASAKTDEQGILDMSRSVTVSAQENAPSADYSLDALATQGSSTAYTANRLYFHFYNEPPVLLLAQTDRPIYRPTQKVQLAAQALERQVRGLKTLGNLPLKFTVTDPNGKSVFSATSRLNNLGTAQTEMTVPENNLLGVYTLSVSLNVNKRTYHAYGNFRVEEYKRPDYELTLSPLAKPLVYGKKATLSGQARYYMGSPLANAKVTYTLKRQNYLPPFYWWRARPMFNEEKIIQQGQTATDANGVFNLSFTPARQDEEEEFANYVLTADVFDESGRTVSATRTYKISAHEHLVQVNFTQGFYDENQPADLAEITLTDADGNATTGKINAQISRLENRQPSLPDKQLRYYLTTRTPLDAYYNDFTSGKALSTQLITFITPKSQTLRLPALPEGVYRLTLSGAGLAEQKMVFVVAAKKSALLLPDVALMQHNTYYPSETMRVLVGAGNLRGSKRVEIYQENKFITHRALLGGGVEIFEMPLTQAHRGGVAVRWFGASDYLFHEGQTHADVPFDNKQLTVRADVPPYVTPGQQVHWNVSVKDATGSPLNGLVNVTVYDKSLDYYAKNKPMVSFSQLYPQRNGAADATNSQQGPVSVSHRIASKNTTTKKISLLPVPTLNLQMMYRSYGLKGRALGAAPMMAMAKADMSAVTNGAMEDMAVEEATFAGSFRSAETADESPETTSPDTSLVRTDFSETAYFNASLPFSGGKTLLSFTLPQTLTTWNLLGFALTPDGKFGEFTAATVARNDLMLRLQLPRFYRENDRGVIQAALTNTTDKKITARVTLSVSKDGQNKLPAFGISAPVQTVTVPANSTQFVTWPITAPADPALYQVSAVARAGAQSDGEQKTLPVLPAKMRLLASSHKALKNGPNTLALTELANIPAGDVELTALTINPSLALSVLNSMPHLLASPYNDLVSSLNRYVPLAVVNQFYTAYPPLKQAVKKLPKRSGRTPSWNENDPLRLQLLEQTPWLRQAQGRQERVNDILNLFDDKLVAARLEKEMKNISRLQNSSGAFSWFAGGPDDDYLTLYALQSFAQALAYQAKIPTAPAQKAISYLVPHIEKRLKQDENGSAATVAYALYAAYTLSAFPATWEPVSAAKPYLKKWVDYADTQKKFMTSLGQIYAAAVYHRLGDDIKANKYLDLVLSRLKQDPLTGAYFAPEAQSWIWYNDTLSTQTVTLRTLLEMRPQSDKIDPLLQWLLFNRQVNDWTDTKAATQAVFTVLDVMQARGALAQASSYKINWGTENITRTFEPMDWTEDLQFVRTGEQITPQTYKAEIIKQSPQTDFASLNAVYRAHDVSESPKGVINVSRAYFVRVKEGNEVKLRPLTDTDTVHVGDEIEVHLTLDTDSAFEYVLLDDPKPAGFESDALVSGWEYQLVRFYREVKDATTHFFINWLPRGTVTLKYVLRPTVEGTLHALPAQVQSMYAPEYGAHSASETLTVEK